LLLLLLSLLLSSLFCTDFTIGTLAVQSARYKYLLNLTELNWIVLSVYYTKLFHTLLATYTCCKPRVPANSYIQHHHHSPFTEYFRLPHVTKNYTILLSSFLLQCGLAANLASFGLTLGAVLLDTPVPKCFKVSVCEPRPAFGLIISRKGMKLRKSLVLP